MRPFVHWSLAWTACFAVTIALMAATYLARGQLNSHWLSMTGAIQGIALLIGFSVVAGVTIAGIGAFFDWLGWDREAQREDIRNPIVRLTLLPLILFTAGFIWWSFGGR